MIANAPSWEIVERDSVALRPTAACKRRIERGETRKRLLQVVRCKQRRRLAATGSGHVAIAEHVVTPADDVARHIEIGFQDFVPKPYPFRDIYRMLAQYAGVRFVAEAPAATASSTAGPAVPPPAAGGAESDGPTAPPASALGALGELKAAAAEGDLSKVKTLLAALDPAWVSAARRRTWDDAVRRYDLQGLEGAVRDYLGAAEAAA